MEFGSFDNCKGVVVMARWVIVDMGCKGCQYSDVFGYCTLPGICYCDPGEGRD